MIKRNTKKKARKEEIIYVQYVNVCYVISIKENDLICCSDSRKYSTKLDKKIL